jgi:hypothetical protein
MTKTQLYFQQPADEEVRRAPNGHIDPEQPVPGFVEAG